MSAPGFSLEPARIDNGPQTSHGIQADVTIRGILVAFGTALAIVILTRFPVARTAPIESDEFGFLERVAGYHLPMHHTLFLGAARLAGAIVNDPYRGFIALDMLVSAFALTAMWWWLRALVAPSTALAATCVLCFGPVFWGYGAMAGNYTAIPLVGALLLGIAVRAQSAPRIWHPYAAAVILAVGAGYRQDIGTFWLPVLLLLLVPFRWRTAFFALLMFAAVCSVWFGGMLIDVGGWEEFRSKSAEFSREAGYLNSIWNLGLVDAPLRYSVKLAMSLLWTMGPALLLVPFGVRRYLARRSRREWWPLGLMLSAALPSLFFHLFIHFGVPGYGFHYVPMLLALAAIGAESLGQGESPDVYPQRAARLLLSSAVVMAACFLFYPTNYNAPGFRGNFDLSFARHTRTGLRSPLPNHSPTAWRTANSRPAPGEKTVEPSLR